MANGIEASKQQSAKNDLVPQPDPTRLTTEQLMREILLLKELVFSKLDAQQNTSDSKTETLKGSIEARLNAMDKAIVLHQDNIAQMPPKVDEKIFALKSIHEEKFNSIQTQFQERDVRTEQSSKDSKVAVDAALQAAKEAVGEQNKSSALAISKSESATVKQMDQMNQLITAQAKAIDDKFSDLKDRIGRVEQIEAGLTSGEVHGLERKKSSEWSIGVFIAIGTSMVATVLVLVEMFITVYHH